MVSFTILISLKHNLLILELFCVHIDRLSVKQTLKFFPNFKDTEILYTLATQNILDPYGKHYSWDVKVTLMGLQREEVSKKIVELYELPMTWEEYGVLVDEQIELLMRDCKLCAGE